MSEKECEKREGKQSDMPGNIMEGLLDHLGMGRWTLMHLAPCFLIHAMLGMHAISGAFIAPVLKYSCELPTDATQDETVSSTTFHNIPGDECKYFANGTDWKELRACTEWTFDNSSFVSTITSEFSLVCELSSLVPLYQSLYMIGCGIGSLVGGITADKYGRRPLVTFAYMAFMVISIGMIWIPYIWLILTARFFLGMLHMLMLQPGYVLMMEVLPGKYRSVMGLISALPWALAIIALGGLGYFIREWRELQMAIAIPYFVILPLFWFIRESPHWLMVKGKKTEVLQVLNRAAAMQKVALPPAYIEKLEHEMDMKKLKSKNEVKTSFREKLSNNISQLVIIFRTPKLRRHTVVICLDFFTASVAYFGLSLGAVSFSADPYIFMAVSGAFEIPSYTLMGPLLAYIGRKPPAIGGFLFTGIALLILPVIPSDLWQVSMTMALLGKMTVSAVFLELFVYASEVFPTEVRNQGLGTGLFASRLGSILSPFINDLLVPVFPLAMPLVVGGLNIIAGISSCLLPETKGKTLPSEIEDLEEPGSVNPAFSDKESIAVE